MITLSKQINVGIIIGSLRKESFSRKIANYLSEAAPNTMSLKILEIGQLSFYNQDLDQSPPDEWIHFRKLIKSIDALIFVTPEYNRSTPGVLKNAIEIGSRPYGQNAFEGKPGAVISESVGAIGGFGANHHLRQSLVFLNIPTMAQPEAYIGGTSKIFNTEGKLTEPSTRDFLIKFMTEFANWYEKNKPHINDR